MSPPGRFVRTLKSAAVWTDDACSKLPSNFSHTEAEFLDEIQTRVLRVFSLCYIHSYLYNFSICISSNSRNLLQFLQCSYLLYTVKEKGGKPDRKPYALFYGLRNQYRNLKSENSHNYAQKPQRNCTFISLASVQI